MTIGGLGGWCQWEERIRETEREDRARAYRDQVKPEEEKRAYRQGPMQQKPWGLTSGPLGFYFSLSSLITPFLHWMSVNDINLFLHCLSLLLCSREVLRVETSFIYAPHPLCQSDFENWPQVSQSEELVETWACLWLRAIALQDVKSTLHCHFVFSPRFLLVILWICLNVMIKACKHFSLLELEIMYLIIICKNFLSWQTIDHILCI